MNKLCGGCQTKHWISISGRRISDLTEYLAQPDIYIYIYIYIHSSFVYVKVLFNKIREIFLCENSQVCPNIVHQSNLRNRENLLKGKTWVFYLARSSELQNQIIILEKTCS